MSVDAAVATMRAVVQREYGMPDVLEIDDVPRPAPRSGEVLIQVRAASIARGDWFRLVGEPTIARLAFGMRRPSRPLVGSDAAGVVAAVGPGVTRFAVGDEVYAEPPAGSLAEYTVAPERTVAAKPSSLTFEQAAAMPVSAGTALQGLIDVAGVHAGQRVLVLGASGGVGTFAVQIAHALAAEVTAVCSTRNVEQARALGAAHVVDYTREEVAGLEPGFDVIFDLVGAAPIAELRRLLAPRGTLVLSSGEGGRVLGPMGRILAGVLGSPFGRGRVRSLAATPKAETLGDLALLADAGSIVPVIERVYRFSDAPDAFRRLGEGHLSGKIVVTVP